MKGIIFYYSGSGNTKLACQYINKNVTNIEFELFNMVKAKKIPDLDAYDMVGFACFTDWGGPSHLVYEFIEKLPQQKEKLAFTFITYGFMFIKTLKALTKIVKSKGFKVVSGHPLHTPENHVPTVAKGRGFVTFPREKDMKKFKAFIADLDNIGVSFNEGKVVKKKKMRIGFVNSLLHFSMSRTQSRKDMGEKFVDEELCKECGRCERGCPYGAITLSPKPQFDQEKCYGCWYCYNHCPEKAIYTKKYKNVGHYPKPNDHMKEVLKIAD